MIEMRPMSLYFSLLFFSLSDYATSCLVSPDHMKTTSGFHCYYQEMLAQARNMETLSVGWQLGFCVLDWLFGEVNSALALDPGVLVQMSEGVFG